MRHMLSVFSSFHTDRSQHIGPWGLVLRNTISLVGPAGPSGPLRLIAMFRTAGPAIPTR
jgi:hypothetical protein